MPLVPFTFAAVDGSMIFLGFIVFMVLVLAYGYYSKSGSGITQRPTDSRGGSPGASGSSSISTTEPDADERTLGSHGTQ